MDAKIQYRPLKKRKKNHMKLAMLTAYDYSTAKLQDEAESMEYWWAIPLVM